jgi:hypothetical protein
MRDHFDGFDLDWHFDARSGPSPAMRLTWAINAREELFVADHLWDYARDATRIADPHGVYRFVHEGTLRLLFGQAPRPSNVSLRVTYTPFFSRVRAGQTHRREVLVPLPIDEYSSLARDVGSPTVTEHVARVMLLVDYRLRRTMTADPLPPMNESAEAVGYIVHDPSRAISTLETSPFTVKRRTGYIARVALAGEAPPGPFPF